MKTIASLVKRSAATLILLLGVIAGLGHLLAYAAEQHQALVTDWLSRHLGLELRIDRLTVNWQLLDPSLHLEGVEAGDPADPIRVSRVEVGFALTGIFSASGPLRFSVYGSQFRVIREPNGRVRITGLPAFNPQAARRSANQQVRIQLVDASITWEDRKYQRDALNFPSVSGDLRGTAGEWRLTAQIRSDYGNLAFAGSLQGDPTGPHWGGYTKVRASRLDLAKLFEGYLPKHYRLHSARVDGELQLFWQGARLTASSGEVVASNIHLAGDHPLQLDYLATGFHFDRQTNRWRLALNDLSVERVGKRQPAARVEVQSQALATGERELAVAANYLPLENLTALALIRPPQPTLGHLAEALRPIGALHDLRLRLRLSGNAPDWQLATGFEELSVQRYNRIPGITGLSGELRANRKHVQVRLAAQSARVDFGPVFRQPIDIVELAGQLDWQRVDEQGWRLRSDDLRIATPDLRTRTRLLITNTPDNPLGLDIQTGFSDADAARINRYYPTGAMRASLVDWLDRAIVGGTLTGGTLLVRGPAADFPFDKTRNGHFEALFGVRELILDYHRQWPRLEELTADVRFHNNDLAIRAETAKIYDSNVRNLSAVIRQLSPVKPVEIRGEVNGPLADELRLLSESPLAEDFGRLVAGWGAQGPARLVLDMAVPITKGGEYRLQSALQFLNNRLHLANRQLLLSDIQGRLDFDLASVRAHGIKATGLGSRLTVGVAPGHGSQTRVSASGLIGSSAIQKVLPTWPLVKAEGKSLFEIELEIPSLSASPGGTAWLDIRSDLEGMALDWPAPLGKRPTAARHLHLRLPVSGPARTGEMRYADLLDVVFDLDGQRGQVRLGGAKATRPQSKGVEVIGHLPRLEIDPWVAAIREIGARRDSLSTHSPLRVDLTFDHLLANDLQATDLRLQLREDAQAWRGELESPQIAGRFRSPKSWPKGELAIDLDRLVLNFDPTTEEAPAVPEDTGAAADPRAWPSIDFRCRSLKANRAELKDLELRMLRSARGLTGQHLRFAGKLATFDGVLNWETAGELNRSRLAGKLSTRSLGKFLDRLGYARQLDDTPGDIELDFNWPAAPQQFDMRHLNGHLGLELGAGRFLDFDPGVTRVVGLLNLSALQRRLRLDFSDLFKRGLSFDAITATFTLDSGDAYTNDFRLIGPSGSIEIAGRTGIAAQDFDQLVSVTPKLDATLPIAGTIAGGPIAGLAAWLAQQLMRKQVDRINRFQYSVKGPWENPTIAALSSGGTLSKIFGADDTSQEEGAMEDPAAPPNMSRARPPPDAQQAQDSRKQESNNDLPGADRETLLDESNGSLLDRFLDKLAPTGSGRDVLEATD